MRAREQLAQAVARTIPAVTGAVEEAAWNDDGVERMNRNQQPSQAQAILERLQAAKPTDRDGWVPMPTLADVSGAYAVHSRIAELRGRGHHIENRIEQRADGIRMSWYRLVEGVAA